MKIKVVSLNIEHGGALMDALIAFLQEVDADMLLLQEVHTGAAHLERRLRTMQYFSEKLEYPFTSFIPQYRDFDNTADGTSWGGAAILSRFAITSVKNVYYDLPYTETYRDSFETASAHPAHLQCVTVEVDGHEVLVGNLHGPWNLSGEEYDERRRKMSDAIIAETTGKKRVIIAGDTNAKPTNEAFQRITHLKSVFGNELETTFNMKRKTLPGYATAAVDMMYISPDIAVVSKDCPKVEVSDHLPLVVELEVR